MLHENAQLYIIEGELISNQRPYERPWNNSGLMDGVYMIYSLNRSFDVFRIGFNVFRIEI